MRTERRAARAERGGAGPARGGAEGGAAEAGMGGVARTGVGQRSVGAGRWWMLGVTCLAVVVINLDLTILNIALPSISAGLHASTGDLQWLGDAYSLVFAGVMVPAGIAGDRIGRKRVVVGGVGGV